MPALSVARRLFQRLLSSGTASAMRPARVYAAPRVCSYHGEPAREVSLVTDAQARSSRSSGPVQVALAEG